MSNVNLIIWGTNEDGFWKNSFPKITEEQAEKIIEDSRSQGMEDYDMEYEDQQEEIWDLEDEELNNGHPDGCMCSYCSPHLHRQP